MSQLALGFCSLLLGEEDATYGSWRNRANLEFALDELEDLARRDLDTAQKHLKVLYARVLDAYRKHFNEEFRPGDPLKMSKKLVGVYLPEFAHRLYLVCRLYDVRT